MPNERCKEADINPVCPYLTQIQQQCKDIREIKKALIGEDMQSGLVAKIQKFELLYKIMIFVAATSTTALVVTLLKTALFQM